MSDEQNDEMEFDGVDYDVVDQYPPLSDFLIGGGRPGVTYAYILSKNLNRAQKQGWAMLHRCPGFTVVGPKGQADMVIMGRDEPIEGASPESCANILLVDTEADNVTGLNGKEVIDPAPPAPEPDPEPVVVKAPQKPKASNVRSQTA
jgi:hypothetical protein